MTLSLVGTLVAVALIAVVVVIAFPGSLINDRTLNWARSVSGSVGIVVDWQRAHVHVEHVGLLGLRCRLEFEGLEARSPGAGWIVSVRGARLGAEGGLQGFAPKVGELGPIEIQGGRLDLALSAGTDATDTPPKKEAESKGKGGLPGFLDHTRILPIRVELERARIRTGDTEIAGAARLAGDVDPAHRAKVQLHLQVARAPGLGPSRADLEFENPGDLLSLSGWAARAKAAARLSNGARANAELALKPLNQQLRYAVDVRADYAEGPRKLQARVSGTASPDQIQADISGTGRHWVPEISEIRVNHCKIDLSRKASETLPGALRVDCPIGAALPEPSRDILPLAMPGWADVRVSADLATGAFPPAVDAPVEGTASVELLPLRHPLAQGSGRVDAKVRGVPSEFPRGWKMDTNLGLHLAVPHFERVVSSLKGSRWDVWAPLRVLSGPVQIDTQGKFDAQSGTAPLQLKTRLVSAHQNVDLDTTGTLRLLALSPSPRFHLDADLALSNLRLELPPLPALPSPSSPRTDEVPQFFPDDRIQPKTARKQMAGVREPSFTYKVQIHTPDDQHPVRLVTSQVPDPVPVAVRLEITDSTPPQGQIRVLRFPVELFRRKVDLDHLDVSLATPTKDSELDGRIEVPYPDYTIRILLLGTIGKPQIRFVSDPPLPDDQIIAVLIFGRKVESLDPDQQQTVGSSRAALREGALNLFSLYYLSSLNVESIDYDPATRTASLRYRLGEGTSLNLSQGAGGGQPSVGLRKRLSKQLSITTTLNNPSEQQSRRTLSTFLEWAYQY